MRFKSFNLGGATRFTRDRPLILMHIFKTAGSSLRFGIESSLDFRTIQGVYAGRGVRSAVKRYLPEEELRNTGAAVYYGHMFYGAHSSIGVPPTYGVFVRSALERALSQYAHAERFSTGTTRSLDDYLDANELQLDNLMTRMISGHRAVPFGELRRPHLDQAKRNLDDFEFVGLVEQMERSLQVLEDVLGTRLRRVDRVNVNSEKRRSVEQQPTERLEELNWADRELYEYSKERFLAENITAR